MTPRQHGVTLLELMVTLSIMVILMTVAVPSFQDLIRSNRLSGITTEFMGRINYARSEAVKRGIPVTLCRSANGTACAASGAWSQGMIVFLDTNGDGSVDVGETVLRQSGGAPETYTIIGSVNAITYAGNGSTANTGTIAICRDSDEARAQNIIVTAAGTRISTGSSEITTCDAP